MFRHATSSYSAFAIITICSIALSGCSPDRFDIFVEKISKRSLSRKFYPEQLASENVRLRSSVDLRALALRYQMHPVFVLFDCDHVQNTKPQVGQVATDDGQSPNSDEVVSPEYQVNASFIATDYRQCGRLAIQDWSRVYAESNAVRVDLPRD